ncbi:hypothetical protein PFISCL1PPCAC_20847, partial [Pristionchus fissidentatus]
SQNGGVPNHADNSPFDSCQLCHSSLISVLSSRQSRGSRAVLLSCGHVLCVKCNELREDRQSCEWCQSTVKEFLLPGVTLQNEVCSTGDCSQTSLSSKICAECDFASCETCLFHHQIDSAHAERRDFTICTTHHRKISMRCSCRKNLCDLCAVGHLNAGHSTIPFVPNNEKFFCDATTRLGFLEKVRNAVLEKKRFWEDYIDRMNKDVTKQISRIISQAIVRCWDLLNIIRIKGATRFKKIEHSLSTLDNILLQLKNGLKVHGVRGNGSNSVVVDDYLHVISQCLTEAAVGRSLTIGMKNFPPHELQLRR